MIFSEDEAEFKGQSLSDLEVFLKTSMEGHAKALHKSDWVEAKRLEEYTQSITEALREIPQRQFWANQARSYQAALREHHGGATRDPPGDAVAPAVAPAPSSAVAPAPSSSPPQRAETEAASASKRPRPCIAPMKFGFKKRPLRQASIGNRSRPRSREASAKKFASILQRWLGMLQEKLRVASAPTEMGPRMQRRRFQSKPIKKPTEKGGHLRRARTQLGLPPRRSPRRPQLPKKPPATPRRTPQEVEPVTVPIGVSLHGLSQSDVEAFKMLQLWPCKHQQAAVLSTKDFPSWLPVSMHYIFKCADSKSVLSGTVQYLGHGRTRTTYALSDKLVLKVGRRRDRQINLAQQTECQLSKRLTRYFPATYACGNVELWENECHQWPKSVSFLVAERVQSMAAALMKTNSKRTIIRVMHFVVDMALQGVIPWDVRVSNLGVRGVQVVAIDSGAYEQTPAEKVEKSQLKSKSLMTPLFDTLKEHASGEMELIIIMDRLDQLEELGPPELFEWIDRRQQDPSTSAGTERRFLGIWSGLGGLCFARTHDSTKSRRSERTDLD